MGDRRRCLSPLTSSTFHCPKPDVNPLSIDSELWLMAEHRIFEILCCIQPASASEKKRDEVISYVSRLIKAHYRSEVFAFGSVPLKTYLPDGDIDLTILSHQNTEEGMAEGVSDILQGHEHDPKFDVKIVKCLVNDISVDISFNQMAGLSALCFLERVLYKFLDYYSSFDWDNHGVCINGVFKISSLPDIVVVVPAENGSRLLLGPDFYNYCKETFAIPVKELDSGRHDFVVKHINIVDPLKDSNNLGRSVSRGNLHRIKCALSFGAQKLRGVLNGPGEYIGMGLEKFFANTLGRNGTGQRADANSPVPAFGTGRSDACDLNGDYDRCHSGLLQGQWYHNYRLPDHFHNIPSTLLSPSEILSKKSQIFSWTGQNGHPQKGTKAFLQRGLPGLCPCPSKRCTTGIDGLGNLRGTGTYIPDMARYKEIWSRMKSLENQAFLNQGAPCQSPEMTYQVLAQAEANSWIDLRPESFPLLPSINGSSNLFSGNQVHHVGDHGFLHHLTDESSSSSGQTDFRTSSESSSSSSFFPASDPEASLVGGDQVDDSHFSSSLAFSMTEHEKLEELRVAREEEYCQLKEEDFPPLPSYVVEPNSVAREEECQMKNLDFPPLAGNSLVVPCRVTSEKEYPLENQDLPPLVRVSVVEPCRVTREEEYQLKNDDFPPLVSNCVVKLCKVAREEESLLKEKEFPPLGISVGLQEKKKNLY
ncbi:unnamed protein product [Linum tenue]|uniref:Polymerase nucleotidyl transferase domain-containing protein n=1 Tax=Linum tenue TaxID=586396 RepID=A0AAV0L9S1_9ROSI|nr:unnamed protein product [Linum tenue]CAI0431379.1 unnamed protein product [Linum tenue]